MCVCVYLCVRLCVSVNLYTRICAQLGTHAGTGAGKVLAVGAGVVEGVDVPVVVLATQSLSDVLPAGDVVPEGQCEQLVAPGDVE